MATTPLDALTNAQDAYLKNLNAAQDRVVKLVETVATRVRPAVDKLGLDRLPTPSVLDKVPSAAQLYAAGADFNEKLLAAQREYGDALLSALSKKN